MLAQEHIQTVEDTDSENNFCDSLVDEHYVKFLADP